MAQRTFALMAEFFDETKEQLSDSYVERLHGNERVSGRRWIDCACIADD